MTHGARRRGRLRPQLEALEPVVALSGLAGAHAGAIAASEVRAIAPAQAGGIVLLGTIRGGYFVNTRIPDVGSTYRIGAAGRLSPVGQTGDTAVIQTTGFIATGMATGSMSVAAPRGTLKLNLTGPVQKGFSPLPSSFTYTITGGTRVYRTATGSGTIAVSLNSSAFSTNFGLVTLAFKPGTTPAG
jgi:hypothetical protein